MSYSLLLSLVVTVAGVQDRWEERTFDRTISARGMNRVTANLMLGNLRVVPERTDQVTIHIVHKVKGGTAEMRREFLSSAHVEVDTRGGTLVIEDKLPKFEERRRRENNDLNMNVDAEIHVPARMALELGTGAGNVEVSRAEGPLKISTGAGNVVVRDAGSSGDRVDVTTGAGNVTIGGRVGDLKVNTGAGHVRLDRLGASGREAVVTVGAGGIDAYFDHVPSSSLRLTTSVGSVKLSVPSGLRSRVTTPNRRDRYSTGDSVVGEIGRTRVNVTSSVGSVSVTSRDR
jgi:hypothetical protein